MHILSLLFFVCMYIAGSCQQADIKWTIQCEKRDSQFYILQVKAVVGEHWYMYAEGEEAVTIDISDPSIKKSRLFIPNKELIKDKVLGKNLMVCMDSLLLTQELQIRGKVPVEFTVVINGFVSDGENFFPVSEGKQIFLREEKEKVAIITLPPVIEVSVWEQGNY